MNEDLADERMIVIGAFRYYLGRATISVWGFTRWLVDHWAKLDEGTRMIILREIDDAIKDDDRDREEFKKGGRVRVFRLGHDCDRQAWLDIKAHAEKLREGA